MIYLHHRTKQHYSHTRFPAAAVTDEIESSLPPLRLRSQHILSHEWSRDPKPFDFPPAPARCLGCSVPSGEGSRRFAALGPGLRVRASSSSAGSLSLEALSRAAGTSAGGRRWSTQGFPQISSCRALSSPPVRGSQARTLSLWLSEAVHLSTQGPKGRRRVRFTIFINISDSAGRTPFLCLLFAPSSCTFSLVADVQSNWCACVSPYARMWADVR